MNIFNYYFFKFFSMRKFSSWKWGKLSEENLTFATTFLIKIINNEGKLQTIVYKIKAIYNFPSFSFFSDAFRTNIMTP